MVEKVISFIEGNLQMLGDAFTLLPKYKKETFEKILDGKILINTDKAAKHLRELGIDSANLNRMISPLDLNKEFKKELGL